MTAILGVVGAVVAILIILSVAIAMKKKNGNRKITRAIILNKRVTPLSPPLSHPKQFVPATTPHPQESATFLELSAPQREAYQ